MEISLDKHTEFAYNIYRINYYTGIGRAFHEKQI